MIEQTKYPVAIEVAEEIFEEKKVTAALVILSEHVGSAIISKSKLIAFVLLTKIADIIKAGRVKKINEII